MATKNLAGTASGVTTFAANVPLPHGYITGSASGVTTFKAIALLVVPPALPARIGIKRLGSIGNAKIEIRTAVSPAVWTDIACEVISARATTGTTKSVGILSQGEPGSMEFEIYDPDRLLDPTNQSGPYYGILRPWLWIRLVYDDGTTRIVIKTGYVDSIAHTVSTKMGSIRANDWISTLANFSFPNSMNIANLASYTTLHTFAVAILSQAWQSSPVEATPPITVEAEPTTVLPIYAFNPTGGNSVWQQITNHATANLFYAWVDAANVMRFRDSTFGHQPGIALGVSGPLPLDFIGAIDAGGIYNSIYVDLAGSVQWNGFDVESKRSVFQWGERKYTSPTLPNPGRYNTQTWGDLVRADRAQPAFQALPIRIWPASVAEFQKLINLEAMQLVVMQFDSVSPPISVFGRAIGQVVNVDADGWSVELSTWIPR